MRIPTILPPKILEKYKVMNNTFINTVNNNQFERFEIEVGDFHQTDFLPQVKLKKWDNECNFSVRLIDSESDRRDRSKIKTEGNKIKFIKRKIEADFYEVKNGYEFEVILKEKPKTNIVSLEIETQGLDFYYQPELTQQEKDDGAERPENVIGSYAVYHSTKQGDYSQMDGKNYRAGKAFHIYRPKIIDSVGTEVWGKLNITGNLLTVEIPQEFLDNAVYPVRHAAGLTFGYESVGGTGYWFYANHLEGIKISSGGVGVVDSISHYLQDTSGSTRPRKYALYDNSGNFVSGSNTAESDATVDPIDWETLNVSGSPSITNQNYYILTWQDQNHIGRYDTVADSGYDKYVSYTSTFPATYTSATNDSKKRSIYCTYTAGGGAGIASKRLLRGQGI